MLLAGSRALLARSSAAFSSPTVIHWIAGHADILGNTLADEEVSRMVLLAGGSPLPPCLVDDFSLLGFSTSSVSRSEDGVSVFRSPAGSGISRVNSRPVFQTNIERYFNFLNVDMRGPAAPPPPFFDAG